MQINISTNKELDIETIKEFYLLGDPVVIDSWPEIKSVNDIPSVIEHEYNEALRKKVKSLKSRAPQLKKVADAISDVIGEPWDKEETINAYVSACPIAARFLDTKSFLLPYYMNDTILIDWASHEMIHFLYFRRWTKLFPACKEDEYNQTTPTWVLSEILATVIARDKKILDIIKSKPDLYECWQGIRIEGKTLTEIFSVIYKNEKDFDEFLKKSWDKYQELDRKNGISKKLISALS